MLNMSSASDVPDVPDIEDIETKEILSATNQSLYCDSSQLLSTLSLLQSQQLSKTNTLYKKFLELFKLVVLRKENSFEKYILANEASDCSLVAKYSSIQKIDLSQVSSISSDSIHLNVLHILHPLCSFTKQSNAEQSVERLKKLSGELQNLPVCLLVHGLGGQMSQFEPLLALLSQCSEIHSLDLPGFGNSRTELPKGKIIQKFSDTEFEEMVESLKRLTWDDLKTDNIVEIIVSYINQFIPPDRNVILIGHSMGSHLCIKVLNRLPKDKVEALILLSPAKIVEDHNTALDSLPISQTNDSSDVKATISIEESCQSETNDSNFSAKTAKLLIFFTWFPWLFNFFRIFDRLTGLSSNSVLRQLDKKSNNYNKARQLRWNLDVNSNVVLKYVLGFKQVKTTELITSVSKIKDISNISKTKILIVNGENDKVTPLESTIKVSELLDKLRINNKFLKIYNCGHSLLLDKPEIICGLILNFIESLQINLTPTWVLTVKSQLSGDKWGLKNEMKWCKVTPVSQNLINNKTKSVSPLLAMKTLRENDDIHSPTLLEKKFLNSKDKNYRNLIAIVDISADLPPYNPNSFNFIKYFKLPTVSKIAPDSLMIRKFINLVDDILNKHQALSQDEGPPLVAIHCHYGFNRTGFLICCYLIERLNWTVNEAVDAFKVAREPGIKHPHFIDALYVRYES